MSYEVMTFRVKLTTLTMQAGLFYQFHELLLYMKRKICFPKSYNLILFWTKKTTNNKKSTQFPHSLCLQKKITIAFEIYLFIY